MKSLSPNPMGKPPINKSLPEHNFTRPGIRVHRDISANSIGAKTPSQQNAQAQQISNLTNPVTGGVQPQNRIQRYGNDLGA